MATNALVKLNNTTPDTWIITRANEIVTVYKNKAVPNDTAIIKGTFIPLASTEMLEFKNLYRERAFYSISDTKTLQTNYIQRIQITNLPTY